MKQDERIRQSIDEIKKEILNLFNKEKKVLSLSYIHIKINKYWYNIISAVNELVNEGKLRSIDTNSGVVYEKK